MKSLLCTLALFAGVTPAAAASSFGGTFVPPNLRRGAKRE